MFFTVFRLTGVYFGRTGECAYYWCVPGVAETDDDVRRQSLQVRQRPQSGRPAGGVRDILAVELRRCDVAGAGAGPGAGAGAGAGADGELPGGPVLPAAAGTRLAPAGRQLRAATTDPAGGRWLGRRWADAGSADRGSSE